MCKENCHEALGYWTIGIQYLHLVEAVISETVSQRNAHFILSDDEIGWDQYARKTKWSDFRLVIPVLFDFYHGLEIVLKGFLVAAGVPPTTEHKLSRLVAAFEDKFPNSVIAETVKKYIEQDQLPDMLASFCATSGITIDDYYQALKYPQSARGNVYNHYPLKYRGQEGVLFFEELAKDIKEVVKQIVTLGRSIYPSD